MTMTTAQCNHRELEGDEEDVKTRTASVRRNLFGPVDHQQLHQDFQRLLSMSMEVAKQRWNFDFQSDRPVPGSVEWEELRCQDVPAFYRSCVVRPGVTKRRLDTPGSAGGSLGCPTVAAAREEYLELTAKGVYRGVRVEQRTPGPKHRQATITDFFTVKKRRFLPHKRPSRE